MVTGVDHLSVEVEDGSGFEIMYGELASSQVENRGEGAEIVEVIPIAVAVSVGGEGDPPPETW